MFTAGPGRPHQRQRITADRVGDGHSSHQLLIGQQALGADHRFKPAVDDCGGGPHHVQLLLLAEIVEHDLEGESVQLRLGKRVSALELDGIAGGEDEERFRQRVSAPLDGDAPLLHGFQQRRLGLGRGAIDLVRQHDVGKYRALHKHQLATTAFGIFLQQIGAGDVRGHQIRRKLDAREFQIDAFGDGLHQHRLGKPRHAHQQAVTADEQG